MHDDPDLAERVRAALIACALETYADAGVRGLCAEGAWEATVAALRKLDLGPVYRGQGAKGSRD
jgi:hypothetical protein